MSNEVAQLSNFEVNLVQASQHCELARKEENHVIQALKLAKGLKDLKKALMAPEVMAVIKDMMNTKTGFLTDKNPDKKVQNKKSGQWEAPSPYPDHVVVECVAAAMSHGLTIHNNEFNIIAGSMYPAQAGFVRKLAEFKRTRKIKANYTAAIPVAKRNGNQQSFYCEATAWWQKEGEERQEQLLCWNLIAFSEDAALGKLKKRVNEWLFNELTGNTWASAEEQHDFNPLHNEKDIEMEVETKAPVKPSVSADTVINALNSASSLDDLENRMQRAKNNTEFGEDKKVINTYNEMKKKLS